MYNDSFEQMREYAFEYFTQSNKDILERWCKEAGLKEPIGYARDFSKGIYTIYTCHPGCLIGKGGDLATKYIKEIKEKFFDIKQVNFVEINGTFVNYTKKENIN